MKELEGLNQKLSDAMKVSSDSSQKQIAELTKQLTDSKAKESGLLSELEKMKKELAEKTTKESVEAKAPANNAVKNQEEIYALNKKVEELRTELSRERVDNELKQMQLDKINGEKAKVDAQLVTEREKLALEREINNRIDELQDALILDSNNEAKKAEVQELKTELLKIQSETPSSSESAKTLTNALEENAKNKVEVEQLKRESENLKQQLTKEKEEAAAAKTAEVAAAAKTAEVEK